MELRRDLASIEVDEAGVVRYGPERIPQPKFFQSHVPVGEEGLSEAGLAVIAVVPCASLNFDGFFFPNQR